MTEDYHDEYDCYADREPSIEELRSALDKALKPFKRREEQVEYIIELLTNLMPEAEYSTFLQAINR